MLQKIRNPRTRPVFKLSAIDDQEKFKPLPPPSGNYPYRLDIGQLLPGIPDNPITFHVAGDTGGLRSPQYMQHVVSEMTRQCNEGVSPGERPQFLFHLGDVVYNFGQAAGYYEQFFDAFRNYPCPIFAIAGNHDGDIDATDQNPPDSLDAFRAVFCDKISRPLTLAGDTGRKSNIQPNVYWILETPLADIIGLYGNVPRFGNIEQEQRRWFVEALKASAARQKAIIVCVHHAPYSADINHGSSIHMQAVIDGAVTEAQVLPHLVLSGHVHNYQRYHKQYPDGSVVPFIVSGGGGYAELHPLVVQGDPGFPDDSVLLDDVQLQNYCDDAHGFIKIKVAKTTDGLVIKGEYCVIDETGDDEPKARVFDEFAVRISTG